MKVIPSLSPYLNSTTGWLEIPRGPGQPQNIHLQFNVSIFYLTHDKKLWGEGLLPWKKPTYCCTVGAQQWPGTLESQNLFIGRHWTKLIITVPTSTTNWTHIKVQSIRLRHFMGGENAQQQGCIEDAAYSRRHDREKLAEVYLFHGILNLLLRELCYMGSQSPVSGNC